MEVSQSPLLSKDFLSKLGFERDSPQWNRALIRGANEKGYEGLSWTTLWKK